MRGKPALCIALALAVSPAAARQATSPAAIPIEAFARIPVMRFPELSPDGTHLAYIRPVDGRAHLIIQALSGGDEPAVVPPAESADFDWLRWANTERVVFSISASRKRGITETTETRLWAIDKDGTNPRHIVKPSRTSITGSSLARELAPAQLQHNVIHWLPDEPHHILLAVDGDHDGAAEVRRIDIRDGDFDIVRDDVAGIQDWLTDQSGNLRLGWGYRSKSFKVLTRNNEGRWRSAEKAAWWDGNFFPYGFTAVPNIAYMLGPDEHGYRIVRKSNISTGELLETVFRNERYDAESLVVDPVTRQPAGVRFIEHGPQIQYFDETLAALQRAVDAVQPNTFNRIVSMTRDRRKVLIRSTSDIDPGTYNYLDRDKNSLSMVAEAMPGLAPEMMSPVVAVDYAARDGVTIPAYLTIPKGRSRENLPLVVMPHGGPRARDDKSFWFLSQFLASRGYAIFQPNFRGSSGYGRFFEQAGRKEWGGKMQQDVTDGTRWLVDTGVADAGRICIVGWSYGGYAAAMGAVQTPDLYQCAASINGVLDLPRLIADDRRYIGGSVWTRHMGLEDESSKSVSPYHQAESIRVPMLIIQAKDDTRVHADQGRRMAKRLRRLKKSVEYVEVEFGGHTMDNEEARTTILRSLEGFLADNLGLH